MADVLYLNQSRMSIQERKTHEAKMLSLSDGRRCYRKNQEIMVNYEQTMAVYVFKGALKVFIGNEFGSEKLLYYVEEGNSCFASHENFSQIVLRLEAAKDCEVCFVNYLEMMMLFLKDQSAFKKAMKVIEEQIIAIEENLLDLANMSLKGRICKFIYALAVQSTITDEAGNIILKNFPPRQDIAQFTGIHKRNVIKALSDLEKAGIIKKQQKQMVITDKAGLLAEIAKSYGQ